MARTEIIYSKWKVFLDGVEIPYTTFSVTTGVDKAGSASITVEPDLLLAYLRPDTMVHIFMWDVAPDELGSLSSDEEERDKQAFKLYWEGKVRGHRYSKTPFKSFTIYAEGCLSIFSKHKMFMSGLGNMVTSPLISGAALMNPSGNAGRDLMFSLLNSVKAFDKDIKGGRYPNRSVNFRYDRDELFYGDRLLRLITLLCTYNASLRLQVARSRILNKIATLHDDSLTKLIPLVMGTGGFFQQIGSNVGQNRSILQMMDQYNSYLFHHYVSTTLPHYPKVQPGDDGEGYDLVSEIGLSTDSTKTEGRSFARKYYRNDYLILPETFYAIPPSCNMIFPDYTRNVDVGRDFDSEPTRAAMTDKTFKSNVSVIAPDGIFRFDEEPRSPAEYWTLSNLIAGSNDERPESAYTVPGNEGLNLLTVITDEEIEKGISLLQVEQPMMVFSAIARQFPDLKNKGAAGQTNSSDAAKKAAELVRRATSAKNKMLSSLKDGIAEGALDSKNANVKSTAQFIYTMKAIADYNLQLKKYQRRFSIALEGHRYLVPGFTAMILDTEISYGCWLKEHTFTVDESGGETSSIDIDYVRPLPQLSPVQAKDVVKGIDEGKKNLDTSIKNLNDQYSSEKSNLEVSAAALGRVSGFDLDKWEEAKLERLDSGDQLLADAAVHSFTSMKTMFDKLYKETIGSPTLAGKIYLRNNPGQESKIKEIHEDLVAGAPSLRSGTDLKYDVLIGALTVDQFGSSVPDEMEKALFSFINYQLKNVDNIASSGPSAMDAMSTLGDPNVAASQLNVSKAFDSLGDAWDPPVDYPFPPVFANMDLISLKKSEEIYAELIGAKKAFTPFAEDLKEPDDPSTSDIADIQTYNHRAFTKYAHFLNVVGRIFPLTPEQQGTTMWDNFSSRDYGTPVRQWEDSTFLRREGSMTLGRFLTTNGLLLESERSTEPNSLKFYKFTPASTSEVASTALGKKLTWDNTIFSKIIDEWEDQPRLIKDADGNVKWRDADERIDELRKSVKEIYLTTTERQRQIINYSKNHFGSRGFDGR